MNMGVEGIDGRKDYAVTGKHVAKAAAKPVAPAPIERPAWVGQSAPTEARPPRPLSPSSLGKDDVADPPPTPAMKAAADRGRLLHALFERLPGVTENRVAVADRWLAQSAGVDDAAVRVELIKSALMVIDNPAYTALFGADALAEAPIAGVVEGDVIAGTVDRLIVTEDTVMVVDFKTGRRVPPTPAACPVPHLRQMSAYHALLVAIFPDKRFSAALLYTAGPVLHVLPEALLAAHKPGLSRA
jgi:ATP-dependent helicase/nuclease subunit A